MADQHWFRSISDWLVRHKGRIGIAAIGHTVKEAEEWLFDWLLYGSVSAYLVTTLGATWGTLWTFIVMAPLSALVCYLYIRFYDRTKQDLFGFEALKSVRDELEGDGWLKRAVRWGIRQGDIPAFVALSIHKDPFVTTIYLRKAELAYTGLSPRDWRVFWVSVLFSNGYWTLRWTVIVQVAVWLLHTLT